MDCPLHNLPTHPMHLFRIGCGNFTFLSVGSRYLVWSSPIFRRTWGALTLQGALWLWMCARGCVWLCVWKGRVDGHKPLNPYFVTMLDIHVASYIWHLVPSTLDVCLFYVSYILRFNIDLGKTFTSSVFILKKILVNYS